MSEEETFIKLKKPTLEQLNKIINERTPANLTEWAWFLKSYGWSELEYINETNRAIEHDLNDT